MEMPHPSKMSNIGSNPVGGTNGVKGLSDGDL